MKKFNKLHVPDQWNNYFTRYPQGFTILESLLNWVSQVDDMVDNQNLLNKTVGDFRTELDNFIDRFDPRLQEEVTKILREWQDSGFLEVIISEALQTQIDELEAQVRKVINVHEFPTIQEAIDMAIIYKENEVKPTLVFSSEGDFETDSTVTIPSGINVIMEKDIVYTGLKEEPILIIGDPLSNNNNTTLDLRVTRENISSWLNENNIGIQIYNLYVSTAYIRQSNKNTIGVQFIGDASGVVYNEIHLMDVRDNKYSVDLTNVNGGWVNENNFYGGRMWCGSSTYTNLDRYGVRITSKDGNYTNNNNNNFNKPSFELKKPATGEAVPILIEHGTQNYFYNCRNEGNSTTFARLLNESTENVIHVGYGMGNIDDQSKYPDSQIYTRRDENISSFNSLLFHSGNLKDNAIIDGDKIGFKDMFVVSQSAKPVISTTAITLTEGGVSLPGSRGVGIRIDTKTVKQYVVKSGSIGSSPRVGTVCYDINGNVLHHSDIAYVRGNIRTSLGATQNFTDSYYTSPTGADVLLYYHPDVAYADVFLIGGEISHLSIYTRRGLSSSAYNPVEGDRELTLEKIEKRLESFINSGWSSKPLSFEIDSPSVYYVTCYVGANSENSLSVYVLQSYGGDNIFLLPLHESNLVSAVLSGNTLTISANGSFRYSLLKAM